MASIDEIANRLLTALDAMGDGYHTRYEVAKFLGKMRLNPRERCVIERLIHTGHIITNGQPTINQSIAHIGLKRAPITSK